MVDLSDIEIRNAVPQDYHQVISVMVDWWDGRDLRAAASKIFFIHFAETTFIAEYDKSLVGFLIGFYSQSKPDEGYIHFAGVHPRFRRMGLARRLYESFFMRCRANSRFIIRACTSPINILSIDFHQKMGFAIEPGDLEIDGVQVAANYLGDGDHKVLFKRDISK